MAGAARYEFIIEGELSDRAIAAFPELRAAAHHSGSTALFGQVPDATAMHAIFARIGNLGLTLVELRRLPD